MQDEIQGYIAECLEISLEESQTVLEAIESQHGLLRGSNGKPDRAAWHFTGTRAIAASYQQIGVGAIN